MKCLIIFLHGLSSAQGVKRHVAKEWWPTNHFRKVPTGTAFQADDHVDLRCWWRHQEQQTGRWCFCRRHGLHGSFAVGILSAFAVGPNKRLVSERHNTRRQGQLTWSSQCKAWKPKLCLLHWFTLLLVSLFHFVHLYIINYRNVYRLLILMLCSYNKLCQTKIYFFLWNYCRYLFNSKNVFWTLSVTPLLCKALWRSPPKMLAPEQLYWNHYLDPFSALATSWEQVSIGHCT